LVLLLVIYFFAGSASQKLVPGVDEIIPFYGWSLFSKVPNEDSRYAILIHQHDGRAIEPPTTFLSAPEAMVVGNRYTGRKLVQRLGRAHDRRDFARVEELRALLQATHLRGRVRYELIFERYDPLRKWRAGETLERRSLARFESGAGG
jgi:hypothetical protein